VDRRVEPAVPGGDERRWIPGAEQQARQIGAAARVRAARREVVVAVDDGRACRGQEAARRQRVQRIDQQTRPPAIEQISGDDEMIGAAGRDAIELVLERAQVGGVAHMGVRDVGDEQLSRIFFDAAPDAAVVHGRVVRCPLLVEPRRILVMRMAFDELLLLLGPRGGLGISHDQPACPPGFASPRAGTSFCRSTSSPSGRFEMPV
jgi:hypothetical protein